MPSLSSRASECRRLGHELVELARVALVALHAPRVSLSVVLLLGYYSILYYTILYYTILYYTILYYTMLYYAMLYLPRGAARRTRASAWVRERCTQFPN